MNKKIIRQQIHKQPLIIVLLNKQHRVSLNIEQSENLFTSVSEAKGTGSEGQMEN